MIASGIIRSSKGVGKLMNCMLMSITMDSMDEEIKAFLNWLVEQKITYWSCKNEQNNDKP